MKILTMLLLAACAGPAGHFITDSPQWRACKIICDHIERMRPYGAWLGE